MLHQELQQRLCDIPEELHPSWDWSTQTPEPLNSQCSADRESEGSGDDRHHYHQSSLRYQDKGNMREAGPHPAERLWRQQTDSIRRRWCLLVCFFFSYIQNSIHKRKTDRQTSAVRQGRRSLQLILPDIWLPVSINQYKRNYFNTSVLKLRWPQKSLQTEQNSMNSMLVFQKHKKTMETPLNWTNYEQKCTGYELNWNWNKWQQIKIKSNWIAF